MLPPLTAALSQVDVLARRCHMTSPIRKRHGAVNLAEYQVYLDTRPAVLSDLQGQWGPLSGTAAAQVT